MGRARWPQERCLTGDTRMGQVVVHGAEGSRTSYGAGVGRGTVEQGGFVHLHRLSDGVHHPLAVDDVLEPAELAHDESWQRHAVAVGVHLVLKLGQLLEQFGGEIGLQRVHVQEHPHEAVLDAVAGGGGPSPRSAHRREGLPQAGRVLPLVGEVLDQVVPSVDAPHGPLHVLPKLERVRVEQVAAVSAAGDAGVSQLWEDLGGGGGLLGGRGRGGRG